MKIKKSSKKAQATHPEIDQVVKQIETCDVEELPKLLQTLFPPTASATSTSPASPFTAGGNGAVWKWPRGDLHSWIPVLDRFDTILAGIIKEYNLSDAKDVAASSDVKEEPKITSPKPGRPSAIFSPQSPLSGSGIDVLPASSDFETVAAPAPKAALQIQTTDFKPIDKQLVLEILRIERLLLDNSTSRKIFAGYDRLSNLLSTSDLQVLAAALSVLLRPAQQYSSHTPFELSRSEGGKYPEVHKRLLGLALGWGAWGKLKERGSSMVDLAGPSGTSDRDTNIGELAADISRLGESFFDIQISFYRTSSSASASKPPQPSELERPTAELHLRESSSAGPSTTLESNDTAAMDVDTPSRARAPVPGRSRGLHFGWGGAEEVTSPPPQQVAVLSTPAPLNQAPTLEPTVKFALSEPHAHGIRAATNSDGLTTVSLPSTYVISSMKQQRSPNDILAYLVETFDIPSVEWFGILGQLRGVMLLTLGGTSAQDLRRELIICRMLALATYLHLTPEEKAQPELFLYEPTLITSMAEVAHPDNKNIVGDRVLASAFIALDACAKYRGKANEVLGALNANVSHGILMTDFRTLVGRLGSEAGEVPHELVDAMLGFVAFVITTPGYGNLLVGAGIIPLLIDMIKIPNPARTSYVARGVGLIDSIIYSNTNAFGIFCNSGGLDAINDRIVLELDRNVELSRNPEAMMETEVLRRTTALKLLLRSIHRMMQSGGTAEGLRSLIDGVLPKSLLRIFQNAKVLGPAVLALAITITATFVHNEPTSLTVIQEMKLHEALFDAVEQNERASFDVVSAMPNAIGAICLNQTGLDYTLSRPDVLARLVSICTNEAYREILQERDNAMYLGSTLDELVRHHPSLKPILLQAISSLLAKIIESGQRGFSKDITIPSHYKLVPPKETGVTADEGEAVPAPQAGTKDQEIAVDVEMQDASSKAPENVDTRVDVSLDLASKFLQGAFHNPSLCRDFLRNDGLPAFLQLYSLPALLSQFANTEVASSMCGVLRCLAEASISQVLGTLVETVHKAVKDADYLWKDLGGRTASVLGQMSELTDSVEIDSANVRYRQLVYLNNLLGLLGDLYNTVGFAHGRVATSFLQSLGSPSFLSDLGCLHRAAVWERVTLKQLSLKYDSKPGASQPNTEQRADSTYAPHIEEEVEAALAPLSPLVYENGASAVRRRAVSPAGDKSVIKKLPENYSSVRYIASQISAFLTPFYQSVIKMLLFRRMEAAHKVQAQPIAQAIAAVMLQHLRPDSSGDGAIAHAYETTMLGLVTLYIFDERSTHGGLHTMLLLAFQNQGGIEQVIAASSRFLDQLDNLAPSSYDGTSVNVDAELARLYGGLKVALDLLKVLVSGKTLTESPQTGLLVAASKDKKRGDRDYFNTSETLVSLRLAIFPVAQRAWRAFWLGASPLPVCRSAVQTLLAVVQPLPDPSSASAPGHQANPIPAPVPFTVNEGYLHTLIDMGFSNYAATHALTRLRNNMTAAAEYLLTHAHLLEPPPAVADPPALVAAEDADTVMADTVMADDSAPAVTGGGEEALAGRPDEPVLPAVDPYKQREELVALCGEVKRNIPARALELVDSHESLVFDVRSVFLELDGALQVLVNGVKAADPATEPAKGASNGLSSRLRLLAVVASMPTFAAIVSVPTSTTQSTDGILNELLNALLALPAVKGFQKFDWLAGQLLCAAIIIACAEDIKDVQLGGQSPDCPETVILGPTFSESRNKFFELSVNLLKRRDLSREELLATLRLLVLLSRDRHKAAELLREEILTDLFQTLRTAPSGDAAACLSLVSLIIRHAVEDNDTMTELVQREIKSWFLKPRSKVVNVTHFVSNIRQVALRDPDIFVKSVKEECALVTPEPPSGSPYHIQARPTDHAGDEPNPEQEEATTTAMQVDDPFKSVSIAETAGPKDQIMQFLLQQVLTCGQPIVESGTAQDSNSKMGQSLAIAESDDAYNQLFSLLLILTELLGSYVGCKSALLAASRKGLRDGGLNSKARPAILAVLLNQFICNLDFDADVCKVSGHRDLAQKRRLNMANWSSSVIVALCADVGTATSIKDIPSELVTVRKVVMDAIAKALKDASTSTEPVSARYGRIWALSDLCYRLLTAKPSIQAKQHDETAVHLAKIMLEKSYVVVLTNALSDVDLNYPNVKNLVAAILQPLEHLTKMSTKMGRATKSKREDDALDSDVDMSDESSDEDDDDEEMPVQGDGSGAPDLYRNSALGMVAGDMDDYMDQSDDEDDEDDEDDPEGFEDDDDVDEQSDGTEPSSDEDDESELEEWENVDGDGMDPHQEEAHYMEGHEDPLILGDADGEEVGEMDDGMMEMEMNMDGAPLDMDDVGDYDDEGEDEDQDDEEDDGTDILDEFEATLETGIEALGVTGSHAMDSWGWSQSIRSSRDGAVMRQAASRSRRHTHRLADDLDAEEAAMFGLRRHSQVPASAAIPQHPLLEQDAGRDAGTTRPSNPRRHMPRPGANVSEIMQSIGNMMGPDAMQLLEHLVSQGGPGGEVIRINYDGTDTSPIDIFVGNHHLTIPPRQADVAPSSRSSALTDSMPQTTMSRWLEEEKMIVGSAATSRLGKIVTIVVNALLPEARRLLAVTKEKIAEEQRAADAKARQDHLERKAKEQAEEEAARLEKAKAEEAAALARAAEAPTVSNEDAVMADASTEVQNDSSEEAESAPGPSVPEPEQPPATRVTIMIHGAEVDITDTGIDAEFLEALPDDMREDVVNQHMRQRRPVAPQVEQSSSSEISPEFLDALPPEIRAEVIQQEAIEAARRAARSRVAAAAGAAGDGATLGGAQAPLLLPADVDPVTFLASLDPALRQVVLMEQDEDFLADLPDHLIAGISDMQQQHRRFDGRNHLRGAGGAPLNGNLPAEGIAALQPTKKPPHRDALQLLDKSGVASLTRLLFFPDIFRKSYLMKVLANLCENSKSRADLISLMLAVLSDGNGDLSVVERPALLRTKSGTTSTPKTTPRRKPAPETPAASTNIFGNLQAESIPTFVAQRCFEALAYITSNNEQALLYFLTEHEPISGVKKSASKKGKSRERDRESSFPIVTLLCLLERHTLLQVPNMMEALTSLLASLTRPLLQTLKSDANPPSSAALGDPPATSTNDASASGGPDSAVAATGSGTAGQDPPQAAVEPIADIQKDGSARLLLTSPPQIPAHVLRLVANILSTGDCTSRTFSNTLSLIHHLSAIPEARDVITSELRSKAQTLADSVTMDMHELSQSIPSLSMDDKEISLAKFSPASSEQAKLLRILKTIDYMYSSSKSSTSAGWDAVAVASVAEGSKALSTDEELVSAIYESFHFSPLWQALGRCLSETEESPKLAHIATVLLPLVESLMVVSKYSSAKAAADRLTRATSPMSPMSPRANSGEDLFVQFTNSHRKILNKMVRNNPSLMSGSFSLLVLNPKILEFDNKRNWFSQQLKKRSNKSIGSTIHLNLRRAYIFEDSYQQLLRKSGDSLKYGKLNVKFQGEEGVDAGGVTREWYSVLAQRIFDPNYGLFEPCAADQLTYQPSRQSYINPEHLGYFKFVGKVIGKAIYDGRLLDAYFSRAFYKQMLGRKVELKDLESVDPEYHKSLEWILKERITDVLEMDFSTEVEEFGEKKIIPLKENGETIPVTDANKEEYVRLVVEHRLDGAIKEQIEAFLAGFYDVIPKKLISIFDPDQLELLISGISVIDVDELKNATQLHGWKNGDAEITWFWRALRSFSQEERARFLMFVTSSSRVPLQGFAHLQGSSGVQPFQIHKLYRDDVLPSSATCFNELLLPSYPSYEVLRARLLTAITEGSEGFGLA